ncbi:MAG: hypothetical protein MAG451_00372 [Anaerolineales bacterium]|nr:hypothetical protein [Anaerolineales bacterium]
MSRIEKNEAREDRLYMEIIVDAYDTEERVMGWYYYLLDRKLHFPFQARCFAERDISPLRVGEEVEAVGMASADDCMCEMFVKVHWLDRTFGVPLSQLEAIDAGSDTQEAIEDWHYWVARGYQF